jgi:hypothetical protein
VNDKGKTDPVSKHNTTKVYSGHGCKAPCILDLSTRRWVISFILWPWYPLDRRMSQPHSRLDKLTKRIIHAPASFPPHCQSLYWFYYPSLWKLPHLSNIWHSFFYLWCRFSFCKSAFPFNHLQSSSNKKILVTH